MLGWNRGSWGFRSDDGNAYEDGWEIWEGIGYHKPYGEKNVTIGCGVNFAKNTAFYTRGGTVIGELLPSLMQDLARTLVGGRLTVE
jgi:acetyltransferase-like isoleucine patch superfamily enzyme